MHKKKNTFLFLELGEWVDISALDKKDDKGKKRRQKNKPFFLILPRE